VRVRIEVEASVEEEAAIDVVLIMVEGVTEE
jgi:hypothetical protein